MKKTFIMGCGVSYCGTTSLHRTLAVNNNYLHTGIEKEWFYLDYALKYETKPIDPFEYHEFCKDKIFYKDKIDLKDRHNNIAKIFYKNKKFTTGTRISYNTSEYLSVLNKFSLEEIDEIYSYPYTLEKYVKHYKLLSQYSDNIFNSVGDFTNNNFNTIVNHKKQFELCKSKLEQDFDVKFLMILRDPIRAYFSIINAALYGNMIAVKKLFDSKNFSNVTDYIIDRAISKTGSFITHHNYAKFIKYIKKYYGRESIHYVIMEDFFSENNQEEKYKLETFLNTKLNSVYPCVFVPDKGINPPKEGPYVNLPDQWNADREVLTSELYIFLKKHYQYLYDEFEQLHGFLPADWGHPIDYGY